MAKGKISLGQLPMDQVDAYLSIVSGYTKKSEKATDTEKVGGIDANKIALAAQDGDGNLIEDRNTVQNALKLGGINADDFITKGNSQTIMKDTYAISDIVSDEMKVNREEMYQMQAQLVKSGFIKDTEVYNGFYDAFKSGNEKYIGDVITSINSGSGNTISVADVQDLSPNEYISVKNNVAKIDSISGQNVVLNNAVDTAGDIRKTAGIYHQGEFVFGVEDKNSAQGETTRAIVKDGSNRRVIYTLSESMTGFGTVLREWVSVQGSLDRVQVSIGCLGKPGSIQMKIYRIDDESDLANGLFLLGESDFLSSNVMSASLNNIDFQFKDRVVIEPGFDHLISLEAQGISANNTYIIGGYSEPDSNSAFYTDDIYIQSNDGAFNPNYNIKADMFLCLYLKEVKESAITYNKNGLYSCYKEMMYDDFTRLRVQMKVNREGIYNVAGNNVVTAANSALLLEGGDNGVFAKDDKIIIGQNVYTINTKNAGDTSITLTENAYTPHGADVYRMGYKVVVKARRKTIDLTNTTNPIMYSEPKVVEVPLVAIIPGKEPDKEDYSSDRLIFEIDLRNQLDGLKAFNCFEVQIYWSSNLGANNISDDTCGKILDLTISTDKSYAH